MLRTVLDLEDQIDAVVGKLDDLRFDARGEPALLPVDVQNALHVALHLGAREHRPRLELDLPLQRIVIDLVVPLEGDAIDDGILDHHHDHGGVLAADADVREEPGCKQGLQGVVDCQRIVAIADAELQIGPNGLRLHTAVAFHSDDPDDR